MQFGWNGLIQLAQQSQKRREEKKRKTNRVVKASKARLNQRQTDWLPPWEDKACGKNQHVFNINCACPSVRTYQIAAEAEPGEANYTAGSGRSQLCGRRVRKGRAESSEVVAESGRSRCADNREGERSAEEVSGTRGGTRDQGCW